MQLPSQLQHESPGGEVVLLRFIHFQGQMAFASLIFTADVVLFAGFSQVASVRLFPSILPLAPVLLSVTFIMMAGGQLELSAGRHFQGAGQIQFPQLITPPPRLLALG